MGVNAPDIRLSADPALTLPPADDVLVDSTFLSHGVPPHGEYICFALRSWPGFEEKLPAIRTAAAHAYEKLGLTPVFLAVEKFQDPAVLQRAAQGLTVPCHLISKPEDPAAIIGVLARMRLVVSMRLHALIFAAGQGVPMVGIVYDPKVSAFLKYIGQDLYLELEALDGERLCALIDQAARQRRDASAVHALLEKESINQAIARQLYGQ